MVQQWQYQARMVIPWRSRPHCGSSPSYEPCLASLIVGGIGENGCQKNFVLLLRAGVRCGIIEVATQGTCASARVVGLVPLGPLYTSRLEFYESLALREEEMGRLKARKMESVGNELEDDD
ncbi:hypothetical protein VNO77_37881 [Canavalia gladiata]|uniref:Uncharacterized protein n=1 Tax=Canavalia gladiata TaxID=3824 RepID=A0AAN9K979_CANGL